ncbi:uncharacterized protein A4U43_C03F20070 [Asparagus officinalis]|uniref:Replication factor A C-terminal domain-containing protein n=1 Tax=Asparagus officinalis TaxID=4686 RepID=A0A5P1FDD1_ASPOF|nr:uncharacterized protein A4U43_C03F20070 [Asparagus officinalis]
MRGNFPALDAEIKSEVKEDTGIVLKPKQEMVSKSAAQITHEQRGKRVHPLFSLNPYQGIWTMKVRLTNKGNLRSYKKARGEGVDFNVELTDEDSFQIQATMFNEAANKFYPKFELGKVYYISKGTLKVANKQFKNVQNDYEMTLTENSIVEEVTREGSFLPETTYKFVKVDQLGSYVNGRELVDVIGIVQHVSPTISVRRRINNETNPKRDITIADDLYDCEGKETSMASISSNVSSTSKNGLRCTHSDTVFLSHITRDPTLGQDKPVFFSVNAYISCIKHDQAMWYRACKTCSKKVTEAIGSGCWCEACQKNNDSCSLRFMIHLVKLGFRYSTSMRSMS